jgi:hypothetical protein
MLVFHSLPEICLKSVSQKCVSKVLSQKCVSKVSHKCSMGNPTKILPAEQPTAPMSWQICQPAKKLNGLKGRCAVYTESYKQLLHLSWLGSRWHTAYTALLSITSRSWFYNVCLRTSCSDHTCTCWHRPAVAKKQSLTGTNEVDPCIYLGQTYLFALTHKAY